MTEPYVTIHWCTDPIEAGAIRDRLDQIGIPLRVLGTQNATSMGVAQMAMQLKLEVPEHQAERARELVAELLSGAFALSEDEVAAADADAGAPAPREDAPVA